MRIITLIMISGLMCGFVFGSEDNQIKFSKNNSKSFIILKADKKNMNTKVSAPVTLYKKAANQAIFDVTYNGFSSQAQIAFQYAIDIWSSILTSTVPIKVEATWDSLGTNVLGSASSMTFYRDFNNATKAGTWYSVSLAEKLAGFDLNHADSTDIFAFFNSNFSQWYFGTDGNCPPGRYDFVSVVLHELCHGLGFQGSMDGEGGQGSWGFGSGFPFIFDHYTENGAGQKLLNTSIFPNPSAALGNALVSNNIYFRGSYAFTINGFNPVKLFAPSEWEASSSYSHLNEATYPAGNLNSLMTPSLGAAEAIHHPGNVTLGMFEDMGWTTELVIKTTVVYPGDTDNNGTVDEKDILPIGIYFLNQGVNRQNVSFIWGAKESLVWNDSVATYADANGDGIVDEKDIIGIGVNWGRTHSGNVTIPNVDYYDADFLMPYRDNFEKIYNSLSGQSKEVVEIKQMLNKMFNFEEDFPFIFRLEQNYPNPFNPTTNIRFVLPEKQKVSLKIFNTLGQIISEVVKNKTFNSGIHNIEFDASFLPNGIYIYTIKTEKYNRSRKMVVLK